MLDSVGIEVNIGDFVSFGGGGNKDCEYGMITGPIIQIDEVKKKIKIFRFDADYTGGQITIKSRITYKDLGKFVKVEPCDKIKSFFKYNDVFDYYENVKSCANWIHQGIIN